MNTIQGAIESVSNKTTASGQSKYGLKVLGKWYNGWGSTSHQKDDLVKIEYITTNYGNQIKNIRAPATEPIDFAPQLPTPKVGMHVEAAGKANGFTPSKEQTITRLACLHYAVMLAQARDAITEERILELARKWGKYANEG